LTGFSSAFQYSATRDWYVDWVGTGAAEVTWGAVVNRYSSQRI
jgi:hypothetical protein